MSTSIYWFRKDLRLNDNPALISGLQNGKLLAIYIWDDNIAESESHLGEASKCWLHESLKSLNSLLENKLAIFKGDPKNILLKLSQELGSFEVFWNRCYDPSEIARDKEIKIVLNQNNIKVHSFNGSLLWEPWEVLKENGEAYKVFSPFYRRGCLGSKAPRQPISFDANGKINLIEYEKAKSSMAKVSNNLDLCDNDVNLNLLKIEDLQLIPEKSWYKKMLSHWNIGEESAYQNLEIFLKKGLDGYKEGRDFPSRKNVSRLSPYLHFGEISANELWYAAKSKEGRLSDNDIQHFCSELGWREFSHYLMYHFPSMISENLNKKFDKFPWKRNETYLSLWQRGLTGYPIVDAGMRELWQTGYMHNRVRMIVGSFLVKNLMIHWREGQKWFWDCLVDADLANNSAGWQWIAGCGVDAAPYFRIFNPITQGEKFDPEGDYIRRFVPELKSLPTKYLFNPSEAPIYIMQQAGIKLGIDYPYPIVKLEQSRKLALEAFASIKVQ